MTNTNVTQLKAPQLIVDADHRYGDEAHAQNAYQLLRTVRQPGTAQEMRDAWVAEVRARQSGGTSITDEERAREAANGEGS